MLMPMMVEIMRKRCMMMSFRCQLSSCGSGWSMNFNVELGASVCRALVAHVCHYSLLLSFLKVSNFLLSFFVLIPIILCVLAVLHRVHARVGASSIARGHLYLGLQF